MSRQDYSHKARQQTKTPGLLHAIITADKYRKEFVDSCTPEERVRLLHHLFKGYCYCCGKPLNSKCYCSGDSNGKNDNPLP